MGCPDSPSPNQRHPLPHALPQPQVNIHQAEGAHRALRHRRPLVPLLHRRQGATHAAPRVHDHTSAVAYPPRPRLAGVPPDLRGRDDPALRLLHIINDMLA